MSGVDPVMDGVLAPSSEPTDQVTLGRVYKTERLIDTGFFINYSLLVDK